MLSRQVTFLTICVSLLWPLTARAQFLGYCQSNADCGYPLSAMYCHKDLYDCNGHGYCEVRPQICFQVVIPVCGCDGWVYSNSCVAASHGVSVNYPGFCGPLGVYLAQSIKRHGDHDRSLTLTSMVNPVGTVVETRAGGPTLLQIEFNKPIIGHNGLDPADVQIAINGAPGQAIAALSIADTVLSLTLAGVPDACRVRISFPGIERWDGGEPAAGELAFTVLLGDTNNDGTVNILDLVRTRQFLNDPTAPCEQDVNRDGRVDIFDLIWIRNNLGHSLPPA